MNPDRRLVLKVLGAGAAGCVALSVLPLGGCAAPAPPPGPATATIPLSEIAEGGRTVVKVGAWTVELRREGDRVFARSLVCTHQGCVVVWQEEARRYKCPCQDAWFDPDGRPVQGPIDRPLADFPVSVSGVEATITADGPGA